MKKIHFDQWLKVTLFPLTLILTLLNGSTQGESLGVPCLFDTLLGIECLGCGMTRALMEIWKGNLHASFHYHSLGLIVFVVLLWISAKEFYLLISNFKLEK